MKKWISLLLVVVLLFTCFVGCKDTEEENGDKKNAGLEATVATVNDVPIKRGEVEEMLYAQLGYYISFLDEATLAGYREEVLKILIQQEVARQKAVALDYHKLTEEELKEVEDSYKSYYDNGIAYFTDELKKEDADNGVFEDEIEKTDYTARAKARFEEYLKEEQYYSLEKFDGTTLLDKYKNYIKGQISSFKWCSDKIGDSCSIDISDEGFKAMQNDPEYEKWVLNDLKTAFATPMSGWARSIGGTRYQVVHYGATKEECHSTSWWTGYQGGKGNEIRKEKSEGAFWTNRAERKEMQERLEEKAYARKLEQQELLEEYIGEQIRHSKEMNQYFNAMHYKNGLTTVGMENIAFENSGTSASVASAAYEANFTMLGIMSNL